MKYHVCIVLAVVAACGPKAPKCDDPQVAGLLQQIHRKSAFEQAMAPAEAIAAQGMNQVNAAKQLAGLMQGSNKPADNTPEITAMIKSIDSAKAAAEVEAKASTDKMTFAYTNSTTLSVSEKPPASSCQAEVTVKFPGSSDYKSTVTYSVRFTDEGKLLVQADRVK